MHDYLFWAKMSPYMLLFDSYTFENFGKYFPNWHKLANSWQKMMFLRGKSYPTWLFHPAQLFSNQKLSILHIYSILHNYSIVKSNMILYKRRNSSKYRPGKLNLHNLLWQIVHIKLLRSVMDLVSTVKMFT